MPKVELPPFPCVADMFAALDRANAEIERITKQRDALARWIRKEATWTNGAHDALTQIGLNANIDGTVTEIGHG